MYQTPKETYQELFEDFHAQKILDDEKNIADAKPKKAPDDILMAYREQRDEPNFNLRQFFFDHFTLDQDKTADFESDKNSSTAEHIKRLWPYLEREGSEQNYQDGYSLIPLPYDYIVPGGRFNEIYYWDSYFTMLGLEVDDKIKRIEGMIDNFSFLIHEVGFIPNGNRTYFLSRSQPPFFSLMVELLYENLGSGIYGKYLPALLKEYHFWMSGTDQLNHDGDTYEHVVRLNGQLLNRYFDRDPSPRQEMYQHDLDLLKKTNRDATSLYCDLRAACESGWDFSCRWFQQQDDLFSIQTSQLLPIDLNCLLYHLELVISKAYNELGNQTESKLFQSKAEGRAQFLIQNFWNNELNFFSDLHIETKKPTDLFSLGGLYPLFFKLATTEQAEQSVEVIKSHFLKPGGVVSTPYKTGQQWDAPNGWAPLQWIAVKSLMNYGYNDLAKEIASRWLHLNDEVFKRTGQMMEKYNVEDLSLLAGGGEYQSQTGFGWTNGVYLKLKTIFG